MNKKHIMLMPFIIYCMMFLFEVLTLFLYFPKPMYFRAWEYVSNYSDKDAGTTPFKPLITYDGEMYGDLLRYASFTPLPREYRRQVFIADEWGFRNEPKLLNNPITVVTIGSSFSGGAAETQDMTISGLLTREYNIPTYSFTSQNVQNVWEDRRFIDNTPKYILLPDTVDGIIRSYWNYALSETDIVVTRKSWSSRYEWQKEMDPFPRTYESFAKYAKRFSMLRQLAFDIRLHILNTLLSRNQITSLSTEQVVSYDEDTGQLYFQKELDYPVIDTGGVTTDDVKQAIAVMRQTQQLLDTRGIKLIIAAVPTKAHIQGTDLSTLPDNLVITHLEKRMKEEGILYISVYDDLVSYRNNNVDVYYNDDTHWNEKTNKLIAEKVARIIRESLETSP